MSTKALVVYSTKSSDAISQDAAPEDIHQCNQPMQRRENILKSLKASSIDVRYHEVSSSGGSSDSPELFDSLDVAKCVHSPGFIDFLTTAWTRWAALPERCEHFFGPAAAGSGIPSLLPGGNFTNRDACQSPGTGIYSQVCYHLADNEAPIYEALLPALAADMRIVEQVVTDFEVNNPLYCSYALITHPGHHASYETCQGYCYINSAAIIAKKLPVSKVAIIDVDYHCGNGTQGIFWNDPNVLVCSIHAHPDIEYPYTTGFNDQVGGEGAEGTTLNIPLPQGTVWKDQYSVALDEVIKRVMQFGADALIVSLGVDTLINDPVAVVGAGFSIELDDYMHIGAALGHLNIPTVFVQEGGYDMNRLGDAVANTLRGFCV